MALADFDIAASDVRKHHFPYWADPSVSSTPTLAVYNEKIADCAGIITSALAAQSISATAIDTHASPTEYAPFVSCRRQLRLMVALEVMGASTSQDPELAKKWQTLIDAWFEGLSNGAGTFLGDPSLSTALSDPSGPTSHISEYSLDDGDPTIDASNVIPPFRKSDCP